MCKPGGGANRCLAHNPVSKFVVKVTTVETKAPEELVEKTLVDLSKEGKNLPSPAPEAVKNWIDTQKFSTQYNPELSEHDRKIQLNRLERAETENVNGSHFHAWKNVGKAVRTKLAQKVAAGGLLVGMSVSLVGCFNNSGQHVQDEPVMPSTSASAHATPSAAPTADALGNGIVGSGQQVKAPDGSNYETISIDPNAPIYKFNNGQGLPPDLASAGYTLADGDASQKFVANYMVKEFVDSSALETKDAGFNQWYQTKAANYFTPKVYQEIGANPTQGQVVLGDLGGTNTMPNLLHDGKPREKSLDLQVSNVQPYSDAQGNKGITYSVNYTAEYRLTDSEAAAFAASHLNMTPDQFLNSNMAKDSLKDGKGENLYEATGTANLVVSKDASGSWKMIGFSSKTNYNLDNFVNQG